MSIQKPGGLKALREPSSRKKQKTETSEGSAFRDRVKEKAIGLKVTLKRALPTPQESLLKDGSEMNIMEDDKSAQPESSSTSCITD